MRMPNGKGSIYKLSGKRRNPYIVRKTVGWDLDPIRCKATQKYTIIGYAQSKEEGIALLEEYNKKEHDMKALKTPRPP